MRLRNWTSSAARTCMRVVSSVGARELTMDHVVPVARGGRSARGNVVASCKECNNRKKLMTPAEQLMMKPVAGDDEG